MPDMASSSCPTLPDASGYGFSPEQLDYIEQLNQTLLKLIRDLQRDVVVNWQYQTRYLDLPLTSMVTATATPPTAGTLALMGISNGSTIGLYSGYGVKGWPTLAWLSTTQTAAGTTTVESQWHCNFRLPGGYEAGTNITLYLSGVCVELPNGNAATAHTIDLSVYRNRNLAEQETEGFGLSPSFDGSDWTWNTDLCLTNIKTVPFKNSGTSKFTELSFTIDGDDNTYGLYPGAIVQAQFTSSITPNGVIAVQYFTNFYIGYSGA